jgi:uncharacterized protein (TIGR03435 family)
MEWNPANKLHVKLGRSDLLIRARKRTRRWVGIAAVMTATLFCGAIAHRAQGQDASKPTAPKAMAKDADPDWEVATVKASEPSDTRGQHIRMEGQRVMLTDTTVEEFLLLGYGVQKSQLAGEPEWVKTTRWDVNGVSSVEGQPSWRQLQGMMQKILVERFGLQLHHEQRELPVFALTVAKGGPRMTANTSDPNGWIEQQNGGTQDRHVEHLKNASMADLALILQFHVDRPVVDQTGLKGRYDFNLQWTLNDAQAPPPDAPPELFTAIQEQIGLKLERVKAPADVLVIDKVEKPGAN